MAKNVNSGLELGWLARYLIVLSAAATHLSLYSPNLPGSYRYILIRYS